MGRKFLSVVGLTIALATSSASAGTVLTFDGLGVDPYDPVPSTYGSRATGTPNVTVEYRTRAIATNNVLEAFLFYWDLFYGDLVDVAFPAVASGAYGEITLTADPGFEVVLRGFDLAGWGDVQNGPQPDVENQRVFVLSGIDGTELADLSGTVSGTRSSYSVNIAAPQLTIRFGNTEIVGIDNVAFGQRVAESPSVVPEPGSVAVWSLLLVGMAFFARRRVSSLGRA